MYTARRTMLFVVLFLFFVPSYVYAQGYDHEILVLNGDEVDSVTLGSKFNDPSINNNGLITFSNGSGAGSARSSYYRLRLGKTAPNSLPNRETSSVVSQSHSLEQQYSTTSQTLTLMTLTRSLTIWPFPPRMVFS